MRLLSRVVWSEGMYLGPHQFQAQNRYFEDSLHFAATAFGFQPYGLLGYSLDGDALRNGTACLLHARGLFADGLPFNMPECDPLPPPREIAELFPPTKDGLTVLLGVPTRKVGGANCAVADGAADSRYVGEVRSFPDENTGNDERPVRVGRKNIRILLDSEKRDGYVSMAIARVMRDGAGHYVFDPEFIPPCLQISASERLLLMVKQLIEILEEKSAALAGTGSGKVNEYSPREIASFWLLHAVNTGAAALQHLWQSKRGHPEEVFLELSRLAGSLCTFSLESHPRSLPLYDHERLGGCFAELERHIRRHLEIVVPTNAVQIPLHKTDNCFYEGDVTDARCFGPGRWVLGVHADMGDADLITKTPQLVKICSSKFVRELVKRAMPGLALTHLPVVPSAIRAKLESQYFGINRSGPFWIHITETKRVGVYVPEDLPNPELDLTVVLD
ncbi:MAG TPA: type VI secretion system baseplate subunit TssK [Bryobacteraceae bacterium]|nr:type VI secretion system baseplate subunit TssK [Bryobacteraceae bacterium]